MHDTEPEATAAASPSDAPHVAVLDDDPRIVESLAQVFSLMGMRVQAFTEPSALESACTRHAFDAFVLDWLIGKVTAAGTIASLRSSNTTRNAPIFVLSGNLAVTGVPLDAQLHQAIEARGVEYRGKPYSPARLGREILLSLRGQSQTA